MAQGNIAWLTSERQVILHAPSVTSMVLMVPTVNGLNGPKCQETHDINLLYYKTIVNLCFGRHGVLLNSKLNHIDLRSASVNMTFTVQ